MRCITFSNLRQKEVINICDGSRLGFVCDIEFDITTGRILAIIVPERQPIFSFKRQEEYRVPWDCIDKIGDDIILVTSASPIVRDECKL